MTDVLESPTQVPPSVWGVIGMIFPERVFCDTAPGWVGADRLALTGGTPRRLAFSGGRRLQQPRAMAVAARFRESIQGIGEPEWSPTPLPLLPLAFPACSFNKGGGWIKCLGRLQQPFWQRKGTAHQDHIPDVGMEIWEG